MITISTVPRILQMSARTGKVLGLLCFSLLVMLHLPSQVIGRASGLGDASRYPPSTWTQTSIEVNGG